MTQRHYNLLTGEAIDPETQPTTQPWPVDMPESWEATAVNLSRCSNRAKNLAWRRIKSETPDVAAALQRDLPAFAAAGLPLTVHVADDYLA